MPTRPPRLGLPRPRERERLSTDPWRSWYRQRPWRLLRAAVLRQEPRCRVCGALAVVVDHITPHRGDWTRFLDRTNLQALCLSCHAAKSRSER